MNNTLFEKSPLIRILNTFLLAGILATLVLILLQLREPLQIQEPIEIQEPIQIKEPISVQGVSGGHGVVGFPAPPVRVEISR
jgi:hypothetical protein